jgi:endonuclease/exonuclease/phosphatase family metal-dependent hydrolase
MHPSRLITLALPYILVLAACSSDAPAPPYDHGVIDTASALDQGPGADAPIVPLDAGVELPVDLGSDTTWPPGFAPAPKNVPAGYLCTIPPDYVDKGGDPVNPPCEVEADRFSDRDHLVMPTYLKVVTWNIEYGKKADEVKQALTTHSKLVDTDVLLLQEVPRYDKGSDPQGINLARELAQVMKMDYVFAVEWDRRLVSDQVGEHGLAVLSKYPIGNVTQIRHTPLFNAYGEKKHFGGRATLGVDLAVGGKRVRVYCSHLCTRDPTGLGRAKQGDEILTDAALSSRPPHQVLGGDLNTFVCNPKLFDCNNPPTAEPVIQNILKDGWTNLLPTFNDWTQSGLGFFPQRLDWLFGKQVTSVSFVVLQQISAADHVPVVAVITVP